MKSGCGDSVGDLRYPEGRGPSGRHTEVIMSEPSKEFINPNTLIAPGPAVYSHVAKVNRGTIVYISGQVPSDASGKIIGEGDFEAQVEQVFANLKTAVEAAGGVMADIVKLNYFLAAEVAQADVPKMRPIRDRYLNVAAPPASTFVAVSRLMRPGWMIEIEAVAAIG
jgi:enamine deaminase RidA (YjgF/YER057c/UK114 family)